MTFPAELDSLIRTDEPLGPLVWLGIGGFAHYFATPTCEDELVGLVKSAYEQGMPVRILGDGSNVLTREAGVDGLVITLASMKTPSLQISDSRVTVAAGSKLSQVVISAVGAGLGGLEHLIGIPGQVGGAVVGNVSAGGRDIGSSVQSVKLLHQDGATETRQRSEIEFSHRKTSLTGELLLEVVFKLEPKEATALTKRMQKLWISRNSARPSEERRVAMPFIDPDSMSAGELIASVGLAGVREGEVSLDASQPQYMVAHPGATSDQCLRLIQRVREQVLLQTGIDLQLNLQIW